MAAKDVASDPVPSQPEVPVKDTESIKPSSRMHSAVSSPVADDPPKVEWHVCPHCKSTVRAESKIEKASSSSSSSSPTTSDISQSRSTSFARLGSKIREVLSHTSESPTTTTTPATARLAHKKPQKKKPKKQVKTRVVTFTGGYEELGADHWADDY